MRTALIDYGSGNLASAAKALARAATDTGQEIVTTADQLLQTTLTMKQ